MKRDYTTGQEQNVDFFTGVEVEHTPAFGLRTLFVVGVQDIDLVDTHLQNLQKFKSLRICSFLKSAWKVYDLGFEKCEHRE